jgi:hypothetical protein
MGHLRSLLPAVLLALNTDMRYSELRLLRWEQLDLGRRTVRVGKSKTDAGTGRTIPLNDKAMEVIKFWAEQFPKRKPGHFAFPSERYGAGGDDFVPTVFDVDPETPIGSVRRDLPKSWGNPSPVTTDSRRQRPGAVIKGGVVIRGLDDHPRERARACRRPPRTLR